MHLADQVQRATSAADRAGAYREYCELYGVNESTARRHADYRVRPAAPVSRDVDPSLDEVVSLWLSSATEKYPTATMPLWRVIDLAETTGLIPVGSLSIGRLQRYIQRQHIGLNDQRRGKPFIYLRSEHPNHVHLCDVSVCRQWFLKSDGRVYAQSFKAGTADYVNKDIRGGVKLYRYVLVDHTTNAFYVQYHLDETAMTLLTFLAGAWLPKRRCHGVGPTGVERWWPAPFDPANYAAWAQLEPHREYPFRGAPRILMLDRASANQSEFTSQVCKRLDIQLELAQQARAKGAVETMMWKWETWFESALASQPAPDLATLNVWAIDFLERWSLKRKHTRHGMTRMQAWSLIQPEQLREMVDWPTFQELATREPEPRTVKSGDAGGFVRHEGADWRIADPTLIGQKVMVWYSAFKRDELCAMTDDGRVFVLSEVKKDFWGFPEHAATIGAEHRSHPATPTEQTAKRLEAVRAAQPPLEIFGREAEQRDTPALLAPIQGVQISVQVTRGTREIDRRQFTRLALVELHELTEDEGLERNRRLEGRTTVPESEVQDFIDWCLTQRAAVAAVPDKKVVNLFSR